MQMKKALVTGGAGFIGSHLTEALVARGIQVAVLDNLSSGKEANLRSVRERIDFHRGDIRDMAQVESAMAGAEVVFHQAALVSVPLSVAQPLESAAVNETGTLQVLEAARRQGCRRVVLASSSAVYGDDPRLPKTEILAPHPLSPYAVQKRVGEQYAALYQRLYGLETVCLRYFNVFGPRQDPGSPYSGVISIFMKQAAAGKPPVVFGDGAQTRDFIHVRDVVAANLSAATVVDAAAGIFNIGRGARVSVNELWERIAALAGLDLRPSYAPAREGDVRHSCAAVDKARDVLGFSPAVGFSDGMAETFNWYRRQTGDDAR
jgi:nucleoside-diphosphate-sugar epimerase